MNFHFPGKVFAKLYTQKIMTIVNIITKPESKSQFKFSDSNEADLPLKIITYLKEIRPWSIHLLTPTHPTSSISVLRGSYVSGLHTSNLYLLLTLIINFIDKYEMSVEQAYFDSCSVAWTSHRDLKPHTDHKHI